MKPTIGAGLFGFAGYRKDGQDAIGRRVGARPGWPGAAEEHRICQSSPAAGPR